MTPQSSALCDVLQAHFPWHLARLKFTAGFIVTLLVVNTVNLTKLAAGLNGQVQRASNYRRLQRFFKDFKLEQKQVSQLLLSLIDDKGPYLVSIDRTNWKLGMVNINILMVGIVYHGIVIPLCWTLLDKRGNSNTGERIDLMNKFLKIVAPDRIAAVVADREFIGADWFFYLEQKRLRYAIRVKENAVVMTKTGFKPIHDLFRDLAIGHQRHMRKPRWIYSHRLYLSCLRLTHEDLLLIASDRKAPDTLTIYEKRWGIEVLFAAFKSRGFDLEQTHITHRDRLEKLIALLALSMTWALLVGIWQSTKKAIPIKKHGRKAKSLFRTGLDQLQFVLINIAYHWQSYGKYLDLFKPKLLNTF
jgi:hypothetical protein